MAILRTGSDEADCIVVAGDNLALNRWSRIKSTEINLDSTDEDETLGVRIEMNDGETCTEEKNYTLTWNVLCDRGLAEGELRIRDAEKINFDDCSANVWAYSLHGCTLSNYYAVSSFIMRHYIVFFIVFVLAGLFLDFLGSKILKCTLVITAFVVSIGGIFFLLFSVIGLKEVSNTMMWVILASSVIIAVIVAFLFLKFIKVFYIALGVIMGYAVGLILYNFVLSNVQAHADLLYWVSLAICVLVGVLIAVFAHKHLVILATAITGSYITVRGISFVAGSFPNEAEVTDLIARKEYGQLNDLMTWRVYLYLVGFSILLALGLFYQYKNYSEEDEKKLLDKEGQELHEEGDV